MGFLHVIQNSFNAFLDSGTSRSTEKLKPLHWWIANDLYMRLHHFDPNYNVISQGFGNDKEAAIPWRYIDKKVDITVTKNNQPIAWFAVKFIMQNYSQNSNNYFENMLGETANIRCNHYPYFQIFIILDTLPYYDKSKKIKHWEWFTSTNAGKYITLSCDNIDGYFHTPDKTLIFIIHIPDNKDLQDMNEYRDFYTSNDFSITIWDNTLWKLWDSVIINDYETFITKAFHKILSI